MIILQSCVRGPVGRRYPISRREQAAQVAEEKLHGAKLETRLGETSMLLERERAEVRVRTAATQAQDAAHAARVERDQEIISRRTVSDYHTELAALRSRAARRLRVPTAATDSCGSGDPAVPGFSKPADGADAATGEDRLSVEDGLIASEIALRLKELQEWMREQEKVGR